VTDRPWNTANENSKLIEEVTGSVENLW